MLFKFFMFKNIAIGLISYFMEIIHIKLTNERWKVSMPKIYR